MELSEILGDEFDVLQEPEENVETDPFEELRPTTICCGGLDCKEAPAGIHICAAT